MDYSVPVGKEHKTTGSSEITVELMYRRVYICLPWMLHKREQIVGCKCFLKVLSYFMHQTSERTVRFWSQKKKIKCFASSGS